MDRLQIAVAILPALIKDQTSPMIGDENRRRVVENAFAWADEILAAHDDYQSAGAPKYPVGG